MEKKKLRISVYAVLLLAGLLFFINSKTSITGAVIGTNIPSGTGSTLGLSLILISLVFILVEQSRLEIGIREYERNKFREEVENKKTDRGLSKEEKEKKEFDRKVESGEWVQVFIEPAKYGKTKKVPQSVAIYRYWGPKKLLKELKEGKAQISRKKAEDFFEKGIVGKTHELVRGGNNYGDVAFIEKGMFKQYEKKEGAWKRKEFEGFVQNSKNDYSYANNGNQVYHRHWELNDMIKYKEKRTIIANAIKDQSLIKLAQDARKNSRVKNELEHLEGALRSENFQTGIGRKHIKGSKISYLRGSNGARVFYLQEGDNYKIIGEASKDNEQNVIDRLKKIYGYKKK